MCFKIENSCFLFVYFLLLCFFLLIVVFCFCLFLFVFVFCSFSVFVRFFLVFFRINLYQMIRNLGSILQRIEHQRCTLSLLGLHGIQLYAKDRCVMFIAHSSYDKDGYTA